ncbi:MAG: dipeptide epimerase [Deltaproteobacteria bacterium]|nr:dipeptide epimerase [Deltaproteobacteria bacterium]
MRIKRLEAWSQVIPLIEPYQVAYRSFSAVELVYVRLVTNRNLVGLGSASPEEEVSGETPAGTLEILEGVAGPALKGADPLRPALRLARLRAAGLEGRPAALAAVDMALWDLLGKAAGLPLWRLWGGLRDRIRTSVTIGILPLPETLARAREHLARGFTSLKLKGGLDALADAERVLRVREAVGPRVELRFDANQGYSEEEARQFLARVAKADLELVEQPTPRGRLAQLGRLTRGSLTQVMADESLLTLPDAFRLARGSLVDLVNVKLMKVGGLQVAAGIEAVARAAGLGVMVGCMDEAALSIAAGLAYALSSPAVRYADLDGHLDLADDPTRATVTLRRGTLFPSPEPGLGLQDF